MAVILSLLRNAAAQDSIEFSNRAHYNVAPQILATYAGTYVEQPRLWRLVPRVIEITVSGDALFADMDGRGKVPLLAQSDTGFSGLYGLGVEFTKGPAGAPAPELFVKHVSGDYRFTRK
jgi:hypothetical protein